MEEKETRLRRAIREMGSVVVSYSGGVDSVLVLKISSEELGERALGVMGVSLSMARCDLEEARITAAGFGARLKEVETGEFRSEAYLRNDGDRCFLCKQELVARLGETAESGCFAFVLDGFNADDVLEHRPGQEAARLAGVRSPLADAGLRKSEVRELLRMQGVAVWNRPATPCLSTRVAQGIRLEPALLERIEEAERRVRRAVKEVTDLRVRHLGPKAVVQADLKHVPSLMRRWDEIGRSLRELGWREVVLDELGYRRGSMSAPGRSPESGGDDIPR